MRPANTSLHALPFSDDFVDVAALNARVSTILVARVADVRRAAALGERCPSTAIAILGPAGGGKTHLFARLRHHPEARATPILLRPYFGMSLSLRDVLAGVIDQLCLPVRGADTTHLDFLVARWLDGEAEGPKSGESIDHEGTSEDAALTARVERAVGSLVSVLPEIAPAAHLARALFGLRGRDRSEMWEELAWLSGREPRARADSQTPQPSLLAPLSEGDVLHMLRLLAVVAAPTAPLVITFDQLENLAGGDESRVLGYGNLVGEMVDSLPCLTIVQLALTSEWMQFIAPRLSLPQQTRVASDTLLLETPNTDERELLLRAWHAKIGPEVGRRKKRFPYPLSPDDLSTLLTAPGMTPRLLLAGLKRVIAGKPLMEHAASAPRVTEDPAKNASDVLSSWNVEHSRVEKELADKEASNLPVDAGELAEGLLSALSFVSSVEVTTRTEKDRIQTSVRSPGHELAVVYLTSTHHLSVAATLAKAAELAQTKKVVIVREKRFELPSTWEAVHERRAAFERLPNARWLWLSRDDTARWLTLARLLSLTRAKRLRRGASDEAFSLEEIRDETARALSPAQWQSVESITRWLSDIPRDHSPPALPKPSTRPDVDTAKAAPPPPEPSLRAWLSQGRDLGRTMAIRYAARLRSLTRR